MFYLHFKFDFFSDVSNVSNGLQYWVQWPRNQGKFVGSSEVREKWPRLLFGILESHLHWSDSLPAMHLKEGRSRNEPGFFVGNQIGWLI